MTGFVKESDEYFAEERRSLPCVSYRRARVRDSEGNTDRAIWRESKSLPLEVAHIFHTDPWHTGGSDFPVHTVVTDRTTGRVIDVVRRRVKE